MVFSVVLNIFILGKHISTIDSNLFCIKPMGKLDQAVFEALADKVFTPTRVAVMLEELKQQMAGDKQVSMQELMSQLEAVRFRLVNVQVY